MKIYVNGSSFTFGDELKNPKRDAWPMLLEKSLNATTINDAVSGGSNQRIVYRTLKSLQQEYDLYILTWTDYSRFTFYKSDNNYEITFSPQLKNKLYQSEKFFKDWGSVLYKIWYNELYAFKLWLQQIILMQSTLIDKNYIMINTVENNLSAWTVKKSDFIDSVKKLIVFDYMTDDQIFEEYNEIQYYLSKIDKNKFYRWNDFYIASLTKKFPVGSEGHFLEEGHTEMANLILDYIQNRKIIG